MTNVKPVNTYTRDKLRGRIVEYYKTQKRFATKVGISQNAFSRKMTGRSGMDQEDIVRWCELLNIDRNEIGDYFFT